VAVPFIAMAVVVGMDSDRGPIAVLAGIGLVGFSLAYFFDLSLRGDLAGGTGHGSSSGGKISSDAGRCERGRDKLQRCPAGDK